MKGGKFFVVGSVFYFRLLYILFPISLVLFDVEFDCKMIFTRSTHRRRGSTW